MALLPELINNYNVYNKGSQWVGVTGDVELPSLEALTETMEGAGMLGEVDVPAVGHFSSGQLTVPFVTVNHQVFDAINFAEALELQIRASKQSADKTTAGTDFTPTRVVVRGLGHTVEPGHFTKGKAMETSVEIEYTYIKIEDEGKTVLELDKLNNVFVVNGVDQLAKIRSQI
ncbi:MAG: phage major tail tube protein [Eubacteriales bacterium]|jgi:P2 family phage contractile tail tube protein